MKTLRHLPAPTLAFRLVFFASTVIALASSLPGQAPATAPGKMPAEIFFEPSRFAAPKLSPDGTKVCVLTRFDDTRYELTLIELPSKKTSTLVKTEGKSVIHFWWKSDDLILMLVKINEVERDFRVLDLRAGKITTLPNLQRYHQLQLINDLPEDPEQMLFLSLLSWETVVERDVIQINLRTGAEKKVDEGHTGLLAWLPNSSGGVTAGWGFENKRYFLLWRADPAAKWQRRWFPVEKVPDIVPLAVALDQRRLIVKDYRSNPTARISYYTPADEKMEEIAPARDVEPDSVLYWGHRHEPVAIAYETDHTTYHFLDSAAEARHAWLRQAVPGTEIQYVSFSRDDSRAIILASSSRNAGVYLLVDFSTRKLTSLGLVSKFINPEKMAPSRAFSFPSSDGLPITGRVTLPAGVAKPALIVRVGPDFTGPRSDNGYDNIAQFFASRGYASVVINHRGTEGFGRDFAAAGDFQMKTGMARDLTEGVDWLRLQGWIDGERVALLGTDRGGLIAFPLAARPGPFRVLLNFGTPVISPGNELTNFAPSGRSKTDLFEAIGGSKAADVFLKSHRTLPEIESLRVPSFHFYPASNEGDSDRVEKVLKKRPQPYEVLKGKNADAMAKENISDWHEAARSFEAAVSFLDRNLPKATLAAPSAGQP